MRKFIRCVIALVAMSIMQPALSQGFLKKLQEKASNVASKALEKKVSEEVNLPGGDNNSTSSSSKSSTGLPTNKGGAGLTNSTPPDVTQQMADAEKAQTAGQLSDARYSIQQALLGVELQLGKALLKSLPIMVAGLPADTAQDRVTSTNWGWSNLTILRKYIKEDKAIEMSVGNMPMYAGLVNMHFGGVYAQTTVENPNMKQIKVKGNKALIKYEESEGYTVLVPLGQSAMVAWQGINFKTESEMLTAINTFDLDAIKKILGEK